MTAIAPTLNIGSAPSLPEQIDAACARIAPAWPLDRLIAVNPYWGWTDRPMPDAAAALAALAGAPMLMPRAWYRERLAEGAITKESMQRAIDRGGSALRVADLLAALEQDDPAATPHPTISDLCDEQRDAAREALWRDVISTSIGRACEAFFDAAQARWQPAKDRGLFACWRDLAATDHAARLLLGARGVPATIAELPADPEMLIAEALDTLALPRGARTDYLTALLLSVVGWGSVAAHRRWEARLRGTDDRTIVDLLAVRIAWELVLYRNATGSDLPTRWTRERRAWQDANAESAAPQEAAWLLQRAFELQYHERLASALAWHPTPPRAADSGPAAPATVHAQAVFCIDVRSEVFRRHLEDCDSGIHTLGFAGFFGVPLAYQPLVGEARAQLPGLLAPSVVVRDANDAADSLRGVITGREAARQHWNSLAGGTPSTFAMVEATGLAGAIKAVAASFEPTPRHGDPLRDGLDRAAVAAPVLAQRADGTALDDDARAQMAEGILRGMSLVRGFAPIVALIGHGAALRNNPQAAGLACGACGGQSGEVNARVAADLLNDAAVRRLLAARGIEIPERTRFVGGLHDTTSDDVQFFPDAETESLHGPALAELRASCARAARRTRRERAPFLGVDADDPQVLAEALRHRGADWSELRPEWGLARNAAFIAAPRRRSRALGLKGRVFLHEYDAATDPTHAVLESILTAPVIVAHWINLQYWASTVDPSRFGSGDKTRHNVVGGSLGVYEGAGGDLRIGLAQQSVHDGTRFVHEPMRLAVFVEATAEAIDGVLAKHASLRGLVEHEWVFLYRLEPEGSAVSLRRRQGWETVDAGAPRWPSAAAVR